MYAISKSLTKVAMLFSGLLSSTVSSASIAQAALSPERFCTQVKYRTHQVSLQSKPRCARAGKSLAKQLLGEGCADQSYNACPHARLSPPEHREFPGTRFLPRQGLTLFSSPPPAHFGTSHCYSWLWKQPWNFRVTDWASPVGFSASPEEESLIWNKPAQEASQPRESPRHCSHTARSPTRAPALLWRDESTRSTNSRSLMALHLPPPAWRSSGLCCAVSVRLKRRSTILP